MNLKSRTDVVQMRRSRTSTKFWGRKKGGGHFPSKLNCKTWKEGREGREEGRKEKEGVCAD
jgi:hypothetical protein